MSFVANYLKNLPAVAMGRQPLYPLLFSYYVTHRCDLNCSYCCDGDGKRFKETPVSELSTAEAKQLLTLLRTETDTLDITGGEPMLRTDLEDILGHARHLGFTTILNTKGLGIEERPEILDLIDVLVLSLDTFSPDRLARILGRSQTTAENLLASIDFVVRRCKTPGLSPQYGGNGRGPMVVLSAVACPDNLVDVEEVLEFAIRHHLGFQISPEIVGTRVHQSLIDNPAYVKVMIKVYEYKRRGCGILGVREYVRGITNFRSFDCYPLLMPVIRPDGAFYYPCLEKKHATINLLQESGYQAALHSARRQFGEIPDCPDCCHIFCHMAISLLQRNPLAALKELKLWRNLHA